MVPAFVGVSMRLASFDQSTKVTGFAILEDGVPVKHGIIDLSKEGDVPDRIKHMFLAIYQVIEECCPDEVVVEATQQQANPKAVEMLSVLQGGIICSCYIKKLDVTSLMPSEWRKILHFQQGGGVKRPELKAQSIKYVKENFGLDVSEDEAEAICIGRAEYLRLKS